MSKGTHLPRSLWSARSVVAASVTFAVLALPSLARAQEVQPAKQEAARVQPAPESTPESATSQPAVDTTPPNSTPAPPPTQTAAPTPAPAAPSAPAAEASSKGSASEPRVRISGRLDPLLSIRERRLVSRGDNGELLLGKRTQATGYLYLAAEASELGSSFGVPGLSLHLNGWVANEEAEVALDRQRTGDLTYGYLQYQDHGLDVRLGRQFVLNTGSVPVQIDGAYARAELPFGFGVQAFGGLSVLPRFTDKPRYYLLGDRIDDLVKADTRTVLDQDEQIRNRDFWSAGGRVSHRFRDVSEVGVSFLEEREQSFLSRRQLGFDASVRPHRMVDAVAAAVLDTTSWKPQELRLRTDIYPMSNLQVSPGYSFTDPTLFLSRYSIFSIFANEANHDAGLDASYRLIRRIRVGAGYHHQFLVGSKGTNVDYAGNGTRQGDAASVRADFILGPRDQLLTGVEYRFLDRPENGFHSLRGYGAFYFTPQLSTAADVLVYFYEKTIPRFYASDGAGGKRSMDASLSVAYEWQRWRFVANGGVSANPLMQTAVFALAKAEYQLDFGASSKAGGRP